MNIEINPRYSHFDSFVRQLPATFDQSGELIYDSRNKVRLFTVNGQFIVVKRYKVPLLHQRIDYTFFRPSKAKRAYIFGMRLLSMGISTPDPIAYIEDFCGGLFCQGYFISTFCGDPDLRVLREAPHSHDQLMTAFVHFLVDMHKKGFIHGDTNLSNFLYHPDSSSYRYHITTIDTNRSHFSSSPSSKECLKSLMRITHERMVLRKIVGEYACMRGWNVEESVDYIIKSIENFEKRKRIKRKIFG